LSLGQPPKTHKLHRDIHQIRLVSGDSSECRRHVISLLFCRSRDGAFPLHHCSWNGTWHACRRTRTGQHSSPLARFPAQRKRAGKKKREKNESYGELVATLSSKGHSNYEVTHVCRAIVKNMGLWNSLKQNR